MVTKSALVKSESDLDDLGIGDCVKVSLNGLETIRWMVYEGTINGQEAFMELTPSGNIGSWRSGRKYLQFSRGNQGLRPEGPGTDGVIIFDSYHEDFCAYIMNTPLYETKKQMIDATGLEPRN